MTRHNIVGSEAIVAPGWDARARAFAPAHGTLVRLPRAQRRRRPLLAAFLAGACAVLALAAIVAAHP